MERKEFLNQKIKLQELKDATHPTCIFQLPFIKPYSKVLVYFFVAYWRAADVGQS